MSELYSADVKRAGVRMSMLVYSLTGIVVSTFMTGAILWFVMLNYYQNDARLARLADAVVVLRGDSLTRIAQNETDIVKMTSLMHDRWTRANMVLFCVEAQKLNKGFVCPSPFKIAPKHSGEGRDEPTVP